MSPRALIFLLSGLEILAILPLASYPALMPQFIQEWGLTNTQAGWIAGMYYVGYMLAVTVAVTATDRIDARAIFVGGCLLSGSATLAFAFLAEGFWSAMALRTLAGVGHAAIYMPGLRALTDRLGGAEQSRAITFYTACYSISLSLSFTITGLAAEAWSWRYAFALVAACCLSAAVIGFLALRPVAPPGAANADQGRIRDVFRNRDAMGYILAYAAHGFELFAMRSWLTAFLVFVLARETAIAAQLPGPTLLAAIVTLIGMPASLIGNELALKFGRRRALIAIMVLSGLLGILYGFTALLPLWFVLAYTAIYYIFIGGDSGALTSGMLAAAKPEARGATMAVHSALGFGVSVLGPLFVGLALDGAQAGFGAESVAAWGLGLSVMGFFVLLGPLALWWAGRGAPEPAVSGSGSR